MTRILLLVCACVATVLLALSALPAYAQPLDGRYMIISAKDGTFQQELDVVAAAGYRIIAGDAGRHFAILQRDGSASRRSYLYVPRVDDFLKKGKLPPGYRLVPFAFGGGGYLLHALFEKEAGDEEPRAYRVVSKGSAGGLRKHFEQGGEGASGAVAIALTSSAAAIYESRTGATRASIVATGNTGKLQQELTKAGARGQCITDAEGIKEAFYLLQDCPSATPRTYEVIAATKSGTFEKELNAAAARGMRFVAPSLVGIEKRMLGEAYNFETVGVVEHAADAAPVTYRVLAVVRVVTLAKELDEAAAAGYRFVAVAKGPREIVAVLEKH